MIKARRWLIKDLEETLRLGYASQILAAWIDLDRYIKDKLYNFLKDLDSISDYAWTYVVL